MERHLDDDTEPDELEDFGFHHDADEVFEVCIALLVFHVLPAAGGWLDQPADWVDDIKTFVALRNRKQWEREQEREQQKELDKFITSVRGDAPDFMDFLKD